jgi:hypothetical protein
MEARPPPGHRYPGRRRCALSGRDYRLGRVSPGLAAERVPVLKPTGGQDRRTGEQFAAALARETETSLNRSPSWRTGLPLDDHERWRRLSSDHLGSRSGVPAHGGRTHGRVSTYRDGCRCESCRDAEAAKRRAIRARKAAAS